MKNKLLKRAYTEVDPELLELCVTVSRASFGFFTNRYPRVFEYTWILEKMRDPGTCIDVGAGVSPIPIILTEWGWDVTTFDIGTTNKNEWGFLDYYDINPDILSVEGDYSNVMTVPDYYDIVYSISAIEHMTTPTRVAVFENALKHLKPGGQFLATLDTYKNTNDIYNRCMGEKVEEHHGTIYTVVDELIDAGFDNVVWSQRIGIKGVATDLLFIVATK